MATSVVGTASMLRARRRDVNVKPNRRLDRKSSRGMLYENEELRLRTININAEVERGQNDIKKLRRENEQLRREIWGLREEYDRLEGLLGLLHGAAAYSPEVSPEILGKQDDLDDISNTNIVENEQNLQNITCIKFRSSKSCSKVFDDHSIIDHGSLPDVESNEYNKSCSRRRKSIKSNLESNLESILPEEDSDILHRETAPGIPDICENELSCTPSYEISPMLRLPPNNIWNQSLYCIDETNNSHSHNTIQDPPNQVLPEVDQTNNHSYFLAKSLSTVSHDMVKSQQIHDNLPSRKGNNVSMLNANYVQFTYRNRNDSLQVTSNHEGEPSMESMNIVGSSNEERIPFKNTSKFPEGGNLEELLSDVQEKNGQATMIVPSEPYFQGSDFGFWKKTSNCSIITMNHVNEQCTTDECEEANSKACTDPSIKVTQLDKYNVLNNYTGCIETSPPDTNAPPQSYTSTPLEEFSVKRPVYLFGFSENDLPMCIEKKNEKDDGASHSPLRAKEEMFNPDRMTWVEHSANLRKKKWISKSVQNLNVQEGKDIYSNRECFPPIHHETCSHNVFNTTRTRSVEAASKEILNFNKQHSRKTHVITPPKWDRRQSMPQINLNHPVRCDEMNHSEPQIKDLRKASLTSLQCSGRNRKNILEQDATGVTGIFKCNGASSQVDDREDQPRLERKISTSFQDCIAKDTVSLTGRRISKNSTKKTSENALPSDGLYQCIQSYSKTNRKYSGYESHFQSLHKMSVIVGDTQRGRSFYVDHSLSSSCWQDTLSKRHCVKQTTMCSNNQRKLGVCSREDIDIYNKENGDTVNEPGASVSPTRSTIYSPIQGGVDFSFRSLTHGKYNSWERANSIGSLASSAEGRMNVTKTKHEGSVNSAEKTIQEGSVPWCGCWGNGCI